MKKIALYLFILIVLSLSACQMPIPGSRAPTATAPEAVPPDAGVAGPTDTLVPTQPPAPTATLPPPTQPLPTPAPPTPYPEPATQAPQAVVVQPTATQPAPTATATSTPAITFDPYTDLGDPKYQNEMRFPNYGEWAQAETKELPDDDNVRLRFKDGELYVTGKRLDFSTWWFSYHNLSDAYVEMTFNTENCSGGDAYGMITRGPKHLAGVSYGYVVAFTCDGNLWAFRLDDADPWDVEELIPEEEQSVINAGADEENVLGIRQEGDVITIFANGVQVGEFEDDHFEKGRVGVFVRAARPGAYTYRVTNFAYWLLEEE